MMGVGAKRAIGLYRSCAPRQRRAVPQCGGAIRGPDQAAAGARRWVAGGIQVADSSARFSSGAGRESVLAVAQGITIDTHVIVSGTDTARIEICIAVTHVIACCQQQV